MVSNMNQLISSCIQFLLNKYSQGYSKNKICELTLTQTSSFPLTIVTSSGGNISVL